VTAVVSSLISLTGASPALADPVETSFAITVNPLTGQHDVTNGGVDRITLAPLPLGEFIVRVRNESIRIEGLVPVTLTYGSGSGTSATTLAILNGTYRHAFAGGWFVGAGQTVYNQSTTYGFSDFDFVYRRGYVYEPIDGREIQYSRVTGPRFEIGRIARGKVSTLEFWVAANPKLHGVQYTRIPTSFDICSYAPGGAFLGCALHSTTMTFADPENAGQIDITARIARRLSKHGELLYGLRYINYTAHYDDFPGQLADRNVGFAPVIGYRVRF
jgi:hypothetical protein